MREMVLDQTQQRKIRAGFLMLNEVGGGTACAYFDAAAAEAHVSTSVVAVCAYNYHPYATKPGRCYICNQRTAQFRTYNTSTELCGLCFFDEYVPARMQAVVDRGRAMEIR